MGKKTRQFLMLQKTKFFEKENVIIIDYMFQYEQYIEL